MVLENLANKGSPKEHLDREDTTANKRKKSKISNRHCPPPPRHPPPHFSSVCVLNNLPHCLPVGFDAPHHWSGRLVVDYHNHAHRGEALEDSDPPFQWHVLKSIFRLASFPQSGRYAEVRFLNLSTS